MGDLRFERFVTEQAEELVDWLLSETWPFHGATRPDRAKLLERVESGFFLGEHVETWWGLLGDERVAFVRLFDLEDETPLFDLRLREAFRGRGLGAATLRWLTEHVFTKHEHCIRVAGYTREDNAAMRATFQRCGYVKEARHRGVWDRPDGPNLDAVGYAIMKCDWESGTTTPLRWEE
ncbi:MAG: GNAT family N-acetyltransferase [Acidobacteriota bacterium]